MDRMRCIKAILITAIFSLFLCFALDSWAETLQFQWTANPPGADGYKMYMDSSDNMIKEIPDRLTDSATVTVDLQGECHNFWLRAYSIDSISGNSDIAVGCPVETDPPPAIQLHVPGGFIITVKPL